MKFSFSCKTIVKNSALHVRSQSVHKRKNVDPGGAVVIILASGSEVRGFDLGRGR